MLSVLIWLPLLGAIVIGLWPSGPQSSWYRSFALGVASLSLVWTGWIGIQFDPSQTQMQFREYVHWIDWIVLFHKAFNHHTKGSLKKRSTACANTCHRRTDTKSFPFALLPNLRNTRSCRSSHFADSGNCAQCVQ